MISEPPITLATRKAGRRLAAAAGKDAADYVTRRLLQALEEVDANAPSPEVSGDLAVACFIRLCWALCEDLSKGSTDTGGLN